MWPGSWAIAVVAADRGHRALVAVVERLGGAALEPGDDLAGHVMAGLDGHRRQLRQHLALPVEGGGDVADRVHAGMARHGQIRADDDPPASPDLQPELGAEALGLHPGGPDQRVGRDAPAVGEVDGLGLDLLDGGVEHHLDAHLPQRRQRPSRQAGRERAEHAVGHLDEHDAGPAHVEVLEVLGQHLREQLDHATRQLDTGRAAARR